MTEHDAMQAHTMLNADFLRARPEYRKPRPGTMSNTIADATMMKAWSPDWNHWFKFSRPVQELSLAMCQRELGTTVGHVIVCVMCAE